VRADRKTRMEQDLAEVSEEVLRAQGEADVANARLSRLQKEQRGLQAALDIMDGKETPAPEPTVPRETILAALQALGGSHPVTGADDIKAKPLVNVKPQHDIVFNAPEGWTKGILNGEEILLEPGMAVMRNSFGEEVIAKRGTVFLPMSEPVVPEGNSLLPPIDGIEDFDSPESHLDG